MVEMLEDQIMMLRDSFSNQTALVEPFVTKTSRGLLKHSANTVIENKFFQKRLTRKTRSACRNVTG